MSYVADPANRSSQGIQKADADLRGRRGKADGVQFKKPGYAKAASAPKSPQAVVKVISQARGHRVGILLEYVARADKEKPLALENEAGLEFEGLEGVREIYEDWRQDFERAKPNSKRPPRHVTHMIFSGDCEQTPENARIVQSAVSEVLQEQLAAKGYRYVTVLHTDTHHPHIHVVINNYNLDKDGAKLRLNPPELLVMRQQFAQKMRDRGLEQHATQRRDRLQILERIALGMEDLKEAGKWYDAAMLKAAGREAAASQAEATDKMLELAGKIAVEKGLDFQETNFEAVRRFLDQHSDKSGQVLGLNANQDDKAEKLRAFDAFAKRKAMARIVAETRAEVKSAPITKAERAQLLKDLRGMERDLLAATAPDYGRIVEQLSLKFGKDLEKVQGHMRDLAAAVARGMSGTERQRRIEAVNKIIDGRIAAVRYARQELLTESGLSVIEGYRLGHQLRQYERELRQLQRANSMGQTAGLVVADADQVEQARKAMFDLARITKAAEKLEAMGAWYEPTPGRDNPRMFDAFAKRESMARIATHLADSLEALSPDRREPSPISQRLEKLQAEIEAPAPNYAELVKPLQVKVRDFAQRLDFDARKAAHSSTPATERVELMGKMQAQLQGRIDALQRGRKELMQAPMADDLRQSLAGNLRSTERLLKTAQSHLERPAELRQVLGRVISPPLPASRASGPAADPFRYNNTRAPAELQPPAELVQSLNHRSQIHERNADLSRRSQYAISASIDFDAPRFARDFQPSAEGAGSLGTTQSLASVRLLSGRSLVPDGGRDGGAAGAMPVDASALVHAAGEAGDGLRRLVTGLGTAQRGTATEERTTLSRIDPATMTQAQLSELLQHAHRRLVEAGAWDDPTPFYSAHREAVDGRPGRNVAYELDAFGKRRAMIEEADKIKAVIDGASRLDFTPDMRRDLAAIRDLRDDLRQAPARDPGEVVSRLMEKVTQDQLRIEQLRDGARESPVEMLKQRRQTERMAERNLRSLDEAKRVIQESRNLAPMQRIKLLGQVKEAGRAMERYSGRGLGR